MRGAEPNFTVVLVDGLKVNDPNNTRGGSFDLAGIALSDIERIEIVRGPQSALYGSDALAGVINIITREPSSELSGEVTLEAGQDEFARGSFSVSGPITQSLGALLSASSVDDGDAVEGNRYKSRSVRTAFEGAINARSSYDVFVELASTTSHAYPEDSGGPDLAVLRDVDRSDKDDTAIGGSIDHQWTEYWSSRVSVGYYHREDSTESPGVAPGVRSGVPPNGNDSDLRRSSTQLLTRFAGKRLGVGFGVDFTAEDGKANGVLELFPGFSLPTQYAINRKTFAGFAEANYLLRPELRVSGSLRLDDADDYESQATYNLGLIYQLHPGNTQLRASYGTAFKLPSFFALANPLVGNPDLKKESATNMAFGIVHTLRNQLKIEGFGFYSQYKDLIDFDPDLFTNVNRSRVDISGAELAFEWQVTEQLLVRGQATYTDIDVKPSGSLRRRPNFRGGLSLRYTIGEDWVLQSNWLAVGHSLDSSIPTGELELDDYRRLDVNLKWKAHSNLSFSLALDNLMDESYQEAIGFPSPGRRARLGLRLSI